MNGFCESLQALFIGLFWQFFGEIGAGHALDSNNDHLGGFSEFFRNGRALIGLFYWRNRRVCCRHNGD